MAKECQESCRTHQQFRHRTLLGFDDLFHKAGTKLKNCFYVRAEVKTEKVGGKRKEYFLYNYVLKLSNFDQERFIQAIRDGKIYIDFDARTGHNHGTKFRIKYNDIPSLYRNVEVVIDKRWISFEYARSNATILPTGFEND